MEGRPEDRLKADRGLEEREARNSTPCGDLWYAQLWVPQRVPDGGEEGRRGSGARAWKALLLWGVMPGLWHSPLAALQ